jgi:hypothetical protein
MIVPGLVFLVLMWVGVALTLSALHRQLKLLRDAGIATSPRPTFNVREFEADQRKLSELRASRAWKHMRLQFFVGGLLLILGGSMQIAPMAVE